MLQRHSTHHFNTMNRIRVSNFVESAMRCPALAIGASLSLTCIAAAQVAINSLGRPPAGVGGTYLTSSIAKAISADGKTVVGTFYNTTGNQQAFCWSAATGMRNTTNGNGEGGVAFVSGMSADASIVVGTRGFSWESYRACVWANGNPPFELSKSVAGLGYAFHTYAAGVSADGRVIAGTASINNGPSGAVRWSAAGAIALTAGTGYVSSQGLAISGDASTVVGVVQQNGNRAMRWTESEGICELGVASLGAINSEATAVNFSGSVIAGSYLDPTTGTWSAFRWTPTWGAQDLSLPAGARISAMSLEGDVLLGKIGGASNGGFIWTEATGMLNLHAYLSRLGLDLTDWTLDTAVAISADNTVVVGNGMFQGQSRSFIVSGVDFSKICLADIDQSGSVDTGDISILLLLFGPAAGSFDPADLDRSGVIDAADLSLLLMGWGECT